MNETMYWLTVVATIFLPLTFLTGFFGMNFGWMVGEIDTEPAFLTARRRRLGRRRPSLIWVAIRRRGTPVEPDQDAVERLLANLRARCAERFEQSPAGACRYMHFMRRGMTICLAIARRAIAAAARRRSGRPAPPVPRAELTPGGRAIAPPSAPPSVKAMIAAANHIRHRPYRWGGGHRNWNSTGLRLLGLGQLRAARRRPARIRRSTRPASCAGAAAGPAPGCGSTPTREHVYAVIAGLRWDTSMTDDGDRTGPGWSEYAALRARLPPAPPARHPRSARSS